MSNHIHPTAVIEGHVTMGTGNTIGPNVVLKGDITIGDSNVIGPGVVMENAVTMGNGNHLYGYVSIGAAGEMGLKGDRLVENGSVVIGHQITIREFVCIHAPVHTSETRIDDHAYLMNKSYVAHDVRIGRGVVLSAGVQLGGRVVVEEGATLGMGAAVHQRCHIGRYAMIGMLTPVTRDILPYATVAGSPARIIGFNQTGALREGVTVQWMQEMETYFSNIMMETSPDNPMVAAILAFLKAHPEALTLYRDQA